MNEPVPVTGIWLRSTTRRWGEPDDIEAPAPWRSH